MLHDRGAHRRILGHWACAFTNVPPQILADTMAEGYVPAGVGARSPTGGGGGSGGEGGVRYRVGAGEPIPVDRVLLGRRRALRGNDVVSPGRQVLARNMGALGFIVGLLYVVLDVVEDTQPRNGGGGAELSDTVSALLAECLRFLRLFVRGNAGNQRALATHMDLLVALVRARLFGAGIVAEVYAARMRNVHSRTHAFSRPAGFTRFWMPPLPLPAGPQVPEQPPTLPCGRRNRPRRVRGHAQGAAPRARAAAGARALRCAFA